MRTVVSELRHQTAYCSANYPVVIVSDDPEISKLQLQVVEFYPDTDGKFKVKVEKNDGT